MFMMFQTCLFKHYHSYYGLDYKLNKSHAKALLFKSNTRARGETKTGIIGMSSYRLTF